MGIRITKKGKQFMNMQAAMMAFQAAQMLYVSQGYLTTSSVYVGLNQMLLTVHFAYAKFPSLPVGYTYSEKLLTSFPYYNDVERKPTRVRCLDLIFKW